MYDSLQVVHMLPLRSSAQHSSFRSPNPTLIAELRILGCLGVRIDRLFAKNCGGLTKQKTQNTSTEAPELPVDAPDPPACL